MGCFEREGGRQGKAAEQIDLGLWWWGSILLVLISAAVGLSRK